MKTKKIKVLVLKQPNALKSRDCENKIVAADIVISKKKLGYEVIKNKTENVFLTLENLNDFKNSDKYVVEEFEDERG